MVWDEIIEKPGSVIFSKPCNLCCNLISVKLTKDYGRGFDESNLRYIRLFYTAFPNCDALRHELSWTHYRLLLKVEKEEVRKFYLEEAIAGNWSTRQIDNDIIDSLCPRNFIGVVTGQEVELEVELCSVIYIVQLL
ncbi:MAG: hypothetical protein AUJ85_04050 [Elusimicrobia bacterium CG1_02_37_114]|nr:MAG: hypothetical protein AUJ85_04050 [Elusimicrobia bacterium CG1_02_37_114]PIV54156.1 MAG: hypothetical protein COS17_00105 [Elusimicrobia bacterium CG02_land_8_20_14_3_00_37_13]PIZ12474.1 MAG: hypothetical protein COY53_09870 [Elusimicrobia bacterium CG_4_10_14_0_8_um_filter_37_32]